MSWMAVACTCNGEGKSKDTTNGTGGSTGGTGGGGAGGAGGVVTGGTGGTGGSTGGGAGFTASGQLRVGPTLSVDTDSADAMNGLTPNNDFASAQPIPNPSTVGGYLGSAQGNLDSTDYYRVQLSAGQSLTLYIGNRNMGASVPDFDLELYDSAQSKVASSEGTGPVEMITAPGSGDYFVQVVQYDPTATGLYTLTVGQRATAAIVDLAAPTLLSSEWPMVEGEALLKPRANTTIAELERTLGVRALSGKNAIGYHRVRLPAPIGGNSAHHTRTTTLRAIKALRHSPKIEYVEPNYIREPDALPPNDPLYPSQWHYPQINLLDAWDHSKGDGVIVAVLDTGVKTSHEDFVNADATSQLVAGYDMIADPAIAADGDGRDSNPDDPGDQRFPSGSSWHGTHTAGTVAAATNNAKGCAGVAPGAKVMPIRVLGVGGGTTDDIAQGVLYASGLPNDSGQLPARRADVINMSLGGLGRSTTMADAIAQARAAGVIVVVSSGNDAADASQYSPAGEPGAVVVGAVDSNNELAYYSNYGSVVDVVAPGGDESTDKNFDGFGDGVLSLVWANNGATLYTTYEGTSMAAPHVAGIAALMKAAFPAMTPTNFDAMIDGTFPGVDPLTQDLGAAGKDDRYGFGLINANLAVLGALAAAANPAPALPALALSSRDLDFDNMLDQLPLQISNGGSGTLSITSIAADQSWISVSPGAVGANTVNVDRTGLATGVHAGHITITTNGGTAVVDVQLSVGESTATEGDVGIVYVLLLDPTTSDALYQVTATHSTTASENYAYSFLNIPPGDYLLVAGTDLDFNKFVDGDGEAFGEFPLTADPKPITISANRTDLDFALQFMVNIQQTAAGASIRPLRFRRLY